MFIMNIIKTLFSWLPIGQVPGIEAQQLILNIDQVQLVDVRTETEFKNSHIAGALNLPITKFTRRNIAALELDSKQPVVTVCLSAHRSIPATRRLQSQGYDVRQLEGGMRAWWKAELPCDTNQSS